MRIISNLACIIAATTISFSSIASGEAEATTSASENATNENRDWFQSLFAEWDFSKPGLAERDVGSKSACQKINAIKMGIPESSPVPACGTAEAELVPCCEMVSGDEKDT
jgi:hypothetical protein